jgi:uncharacterized protein (TIRG00374 family)
MGEMSETVELRHAREGTERGGWSRVLRRLLPGGAGLAAIAGLVVVLDPAAIGRAMAHFDLRLIVPVLALTAGIYALQGLRWHYLLREAGIRLSMGDSLLLNAAGQTVTALVPLGDLTRALFASQASGQAFGLTAATVTVQELTYTLMLILLALPLVMTLHFGIPMVVATLAGMAAIVLVLTISPLFRALHAMIARIPLLRLMLPAIRELQQEVAELLHRRETLAWSALDLARAAANVTVLWLLAQSISPGLVTWWAAAVVLALSSIGGAISLIPGGIGANEASMAGLLIVFGAAHGPAGAVALLQRALMTGMALILGFTAYSRVHRRLGLGGVFSVTLRDPSSAA